MGDKKVFCSFADARKESGLSQTELSRRTGIIQADISRIENNIANPTMQVLERLAKAMDMKLETRFVKDMGR